MSLVNSYFVIVIIKWRHCLAKIKQMFQVVQCMIVVLPVLS